jgi:hypothetical protein
VALELPIRFKLHSFDPTDLEIQLPNEPQPKYASYVELKLFFRKNGLTEDLAGRVLDKCVNFGSCELKESLLVV